MSEWETEEEKEAKRDAAESTEVRTERGMREVLSSGMPNEEKSMGVVAYRRLRKHAIGGVGTYRGKVLTAPGCGYLEALAAYFYE